MLSFIKPGIKTVIADIRNDRALGFIILINFILHLWGICWGLPNSISWAIDTIVPHKVLIGMAHGFSFGYVSDYPIVHFVILGVLFIPVIFCGVIYVLSSQPWSSLAALIGMARSGKTHELLPMVQSLVNIRVFSTIFILIGNVVSVLMSLGIVYLVYRCCRELFDRRSGLIATLILTCNPAFNYYSHFANLEIPYLFWSLAALWYLIKIVRYNDTAAYKYAAVFIALAIGTKDQAYALFILPLVVVFIVIPLADAGAASVLSRIFTKKLRIFILAFIVTFVIAENIILNITGFIGHVKLLVGPNSADYASYASTLTGYAALLKNLIRVICDIIPGIPVFLFSVIGIGLVYFNEKKSTRYAGEKLIFFYAALSFTLFFNTIAKRHDERFVLPQSLFLSLYAGYAVSYFLTMIRGRYRYALYALLLPVTGIALYATLSVNANFFFDVRYRATEWMDRSIPKGSVVEFYNYREYLPQIPAGLKESWIKKNQLEIEKRHPDFIILSDKNYRRYFEDKKSQDGKIISARRKKYLGTETAQLLSMLFENRLPYHIIQEFNHYVPFFKTLRFVPKKIIIFQRNTVHSGNIVPSKKPGI